MSYHQQILRVDLSQSRTYAEELSPGLLRKYFGGVGIAAKVLWEKTRADTDPFSEGNPLVFMVGPITGTQVPESSRCVVAGISPLTGIWGEAHMGGDWPDALHHAGFMGIIVEGKSPKPVYLSIYNGDVAIRDASHLWGLDIFAADETLRNEVGGKATTAAIGPAGERMVRMASIIGDGRRKGRAAARCGLGALMGSKRLKAIVIRGELEIAAHDKEALSRSVARIYAANPIRRHEEVLPIEVNRLRRHFDTGDYPVRNFREGVFEPILQLADALSDTSPLLCQHCPYGCTESKLQPNGERHMVYEHALSLGTNCLIGDERMLQDAYDICQRLGLDSISVGIAIGFAMECCEKGLITKKDTGDLDLTWGNGQAALRLVQQIGLREGFGEVLGDGVKRAAERIGGLAPEYAMHVKGLEFTLHDPRAAASMAVSYATASIGAGHYEGIGAWSVEELVPTYDDKGLTLPEFGFPKRLPRFQTEEKGRLMARLQNYGCLLNSAMVCGFLFSHRRVGPSHLLELTNATTGWDMTQEDFLAMGERIFNLKRLFNVRRGISRKDDTLPARILTHKRGGGSAGEYLPNLGAMLNEYYACRGWSEEGIPTWETLERLDLIGEIVSDKTPLLQAFYREPIGRLNTIGKSSE